MNNVTENMIKYRVTYLEMINYPNFNWPITPKQKLNILLSENIPDWYFLFLYKTIGSSYDWTDQIIKTEKERNSFINNENVKFFTLIKQGWTAGFYILDFREKFVCRKRCFMDAVLDAKKTNRDVLMTYHSTYITFQCT